MPYDPQPHAARPVAEPDVAGLLGLVQRTCQALQAMVASLDALDSVLLRLQRLGPPTDPPTALMTGTCDTVSRVIALLRREGPPLLLRAQALRLQGQAATGPAAVAMRKIHADLDALAAFQIEDAGHWGFFVRRLRANTTVLLAEFDGQRRRMTASGPQPASRHGNAPAQAAAAF
jgi:hypothetical protein